MQQINVHEAKTQFFKLITSVENGEEIIIARSGKPVARLAPVSEITLSRKPGSAKGKFTVPPDFFQPLPDYIINAFEK
ncbi:type II toxin-antitoxin system Phd/YefM family antitoxin [Desulfobacterales bacterium HSG16]|nr:type II toxin-antitoxin system Phd/YefM family antitoxin [Desulfobacterales bacterium HSG16]